jgi:hypothetical protein
MLIAIVEPWQLSVYFVAKREQQYGALSDLGYKDAGKEYLKLGALPKQLWALYRSTVHNCTIEQGKLHKLNLYFTY